MLTNEQKAVLYVLRLIKVNWDSNNDYRGLLVTLSAMREMGMLRLLDLLLMPGEFREIVLYTLRHSKNKSNQQDSSEG